MRVSQHIVGEARTILSMRPELPRQIKSAPLFYVAHETDDSILAFTALEYNGTIYKIGTQKLAQ